MKLSEGHTGDIGQSVCSKKKLIVGFDANDQTTVFEEAVTQIWEIYFIKLKDS